MNELDIKTISEATHHDAAADFVGYVDDMVTPLTMDQREALRVKAQFWFLMAYNKGRLGMPL